MTELGVDPKPPDSYSKILLDHIMLLINRASLIKILKTKLPGMIGCLLHLMDILKVQNNTFIPKMITSESLQT